MKWVKDLLATVKVVESSEMLIQEDKNALRCLRLKFAQLAFGGVV
jgi:hypothetical protein